MAEELKYEVWFGEDDWKFGADGVVEYSPIQNLGHFSPKIGPVTYGCSSFAGHDLERSTKLINTKVFALEFFGETDEELYHEAWADPLRAEVLKKLTGKGRSWYISFVSDITERLILDDGRKVPEKIFKYFSTMDPSRVAIIRSEIPYGAGRGFMKKLIFEIPNEEIEWAVQNIWHVSREVYPIEGYNLPSGRMDMIRNWDQKQRDDALFQDVLEKSFLLFFTYPEEPRHFKFLTNHLEKNEFAKMINIDLLQQKANEIGRKRDLDNSK